MSLSFVQSILSEALAGANLPPATLSSSGATIINMRGLEIGLEYLEAENSVALYCSTGRLPAEASPELYEFLLEKNLLGAKTGGGHLGLYTPARTLVFSLVLSVSGLTAARLSNALERFTETAATLIAEVEERLSLSVSVTEISPLMSNMLWV